MSLADAFKVLSKLGLSTKLHDDDYVDQLTHVVTPTLLLISASATYLKHYLGDSIHCWTPAEYKDKDIYQPYVDNYCWISELYNVPFDNPLPKEEEDRFESPVTFYRWVSVVLLLQALMFKLPNVVWMSWKGFSGMDPDRIIKMVDEIELGHEVEEEEESQGGITLDATPPITKIDNNGITVVSPPKPVKKTGSKKEHKLLTVARFIDRSLRFNTKRERCCGGLTSILSRASGGYITYLFCLIKLLYLSIIIIQFFILSSFLNINFFAYGYEVLKENQHWRSWEDEAVFPRVAYCDFHIRQLQNVQTFTVQCVLSMNIFIEKIYTIQWFWLIFLLAISSIHTIQAYIDKLSLAKRMKFVRKSIKIGVRSEIWPPKSTKTYVSEQDALDSRKIFRHLSERDRQKIIELVINRKFIQDFVGNYLKADGLFILNAVHDNCNGASSLLILFRLLELYLVKSNHISVEDGHVFIH